MNYEITVITLTSPAPKGTSGTDKYIPFSSTSQISPWTMDYLDVQTMHVSDDDGALDGIYGSRLYDGAVDSNQVLTEDITLGTGSSTTTISAGTAVGYDFSGIILKYENGEVVAAYEVAFPRITTASGLGTLAGGEYSVLVVPITYTLKSGEVLQPQAFDPDASYVYGRNLDYNSSDHEIDYFVVDCFATGTLIDTPGGPRRVETLRAGDAVLTRDHGAQQLFWAGHVQIDARRMDLQPNLRPIRIAAGALGPGLPRRDLVLSPQHRVLVRSAIVARMFEADEILVAAKHLVGLPGIEVIAPSQGVGYHHLLFDRHQIVRSEGSWSESLYLGTQAIRGLDAAARREIVALFPELARPGWHPEGARRLLTGKEGRKLAMRHGKNRKPLFSERADFQAQALLPG